LGQTLNWLCYYPILVFGMFVACRDALLKAPIFESLDQGLDELKVKSLEMAIDRQLLTGLGVNISEKRERAKLARSLREKGISICAILLDNDFIREDVKGEIDYVLKTCEAAVDLGVKVARINALMREAPGFTLEKYIERAASSIKACNRSLAELGVSLAVENHGVIANRREFLQGLLKEVGSENLGLTLDTGNFYWFGYPIQEVYDIIREFAGHVKHTHIKNATTERKNERRKPREIVMAPLYEGDLNLKLVVNTLKRAGYDHDLTIEDESLGRFSPEERRKILKKDADFLRSLLG